VWVVRVGEYVRVVYFCGSRFLLFVLLRMAMPGLPLLKPLVFIDWNNINSHNSVDCHPTEKERLMCYNVFQSHGKDYAEEKHRNHRASIWS